MLVKYITRSLYDNCEDSVEEYVTAEVDTVHGEAVVAEVDHRPVDIVDLEGKVITVSESPSYSVIFLPTILGATFWT